MIPLSDANRRTRFPIVNILLITLNVLVYFYETTLGAGINLEGQSREFSTFLDTWAVIPTEYTQGADIGPTPSPLFLTLLSSMFMHGNLLHIGSNMLYLWVFGDNVESNMGHVKYLIFYLLSGVLASIAHILFNFSSSVPSLGASGAIAGVLGAYLVLFPRAQVRTLVIFVIFITIIRISALLLIGIWFAIQFMQGVLSLGAETAQTGGVAVWAHVGGFVAGAILVFLFRGPRKRFTGRDYVPGPPTGY